MHLVLLRLLFFGMLLWLLVGGWASADACGFKKVLKQWEL